MPALLSRRPPGVDFDVERRLRAGRNNRITAAAVLGVMGLMAAVGLTYALYSVSDRRVHDTAMPPPHRRSPLAGPAGGADARRDAARRPGAPLRWPPIGRDRRRWRPGGPSCGRTRPGRELLNSLLFRVGKVRSAQRRPDLEPLDRLEDGGDRSSRPRRQGGGGIPARAAVLVVRTVRPYDAGRGADGPRGPKLEPDAGQATPYTRASRGDEGGLRLTLVVRRRADSGDRPDGRAFGGGPRAAGRGTGTPDGGGAGTAGATSDFGAGRPGSWAIPRTGGEPARRCCLRRTGGEGHRPLRPGSPRLRPAGAGGCW